MQLFDSPQAALGFTRQQTAHIETEVYRTQYPEITYAQLIPVDSSAPEWIKTYVYRSTDAVGLPKFVSGGAQDIPFADVNRSETEKPVYMAALGYRYTLEEINQARMLGIPLESDKVFAVREGYEQFMEGLAFDGDTEKNWLGFFSQTSVTAVSAPNGAAAASEWSTKTPDEILADVNTILTGLHTASLTVEMADTLLLPTAQFTDIASRRLTDTGQTVLEFIQRANVYTATTGRALDIRSQRRLAGKGAGATDRMMAYRRDPQVVRMHLPMPLQFLQAFPWLMEVIVPAMFRMGEVNVRRPGACRYMDGI